MKQLVAVLVAAMFAATSFAALAQDKSGKMEKKSEASSKMDKKDKKDKKKAKKSEKKSAMEKK
jgi:Ni/Co efflux regulator RcnB